MTKKRIVLVGHDAAPSGCFERLASVLEERGFQVVKFLGFGKPRTNTDEGVVETVSQADIVLLGFSSTAELSQSALVAGQAAQANGIPYGFYGDIPFIWTLGRTWFSELASNAAFYCGIKPNEPAKAQKVFPKARFVNTGNPLREEMAFPKYTRAEVRWQLGLEPEEKAILLTTLKSPGCNMAQLGILMEALAGLKHSGHRFQLLVSCHPGDRTPFAVDPGAKDDPKPMGLYEELLSYSPVPSQMVDRAVLTGSELVPGMDLIVQFDSSLAREASFHQIPVITLGLEILLRQFEQETGKRITEAEEQGLSVPVSGNPLIIANTIHDLLTPENDSLTLQTLRANQRGLCAKPVERGAALRQIADLVESVGRQTLAHAP